MKFSIVWSEKKNNDWIVANLRNEAGMEYSDVSINRTNKKGEVFPKFDEIMTGHDIQGEYWETPDKSKKYLFPPKLATTGFVGRQRAGNSEAIKEAQATKAKNILEAQDRSAWMWAKTNASTILSGEDGRFAGCNNDEIAEKIIDLATKIYNAEPIAPF